MDKLASVKLIRISLDYIPWRESPGTSGYVLTVYEKSRLKLEPSISGSVAHLPARETGCLLVYRLYQLTRDKQQRTS